MDTELFHYRSPIGMLEGECKRGRLVGLKFVEYDGLVAQPKRGLQSDVCRWLDIYFGGGKPDFDLPLELNGTDWQRAVWRQMAEIPYGEKRSYGELAKQMGCGAAQAVGQAVGRNPVAIVMPCHRVVAANGGLGGYAYGTERKRWLLTLEERN